MVETRPGGHHRRRRRRHLHRVSPDRARLDRHRPRRPRRADLGLDVPLGRARRAAAQLGDADQDDDVRRRPVPAPGRRDRRRTRPGTRSARSGSPRRPERFEELRRQAGWAKTFGLPLELITAGRGAGPLPADVDRRRPRARSGCRPTAGSTRPGSPRRSPPARGQRGATIRPHTRVVGDRRGARPRHRRHRRAPGRARARSAADVVVNAGGMFAPEIGRMVGVTVPIIPMAHQYLFTEAIDGVHAGLPQLRDPDNLVYFREEVGGLCMGGYERDPAPWALDGIPADFNGKLLAPDMAALRVDHGGRHPAGPGDGRRGRQPGHQRPRGVHAGQRVHPRRIGGRAGSSSPPGSRPTASPGAGGIGRQMATWIVEGEPELDLWKMDIRRFGPAYRSQRYTLARSIENYATYYDIHYPNEERQAGRPLRTSPTYETLAGARRVVRREVRLGAPELVRVERRGRRRGAPPARLGGSALVAGDRRRGARDADGRRAVRRDVVRQARGRRAGRRRRSSSACAPTTSTGPVGSIVYTQLLDRRGGIQADLTVTRLGARDVPARHRDGGRQPRRGLAAPAPARRRDA